MTEPTTEQRLAWQEARMRREEEDQMNAERELTTLREQVKLLRAACEVAEKFLKLRSHSQAVWSAGLSDVYVSHAKSLSAALAATAKEPTQ